MITARDRPPEEAAEDTSFARGLRMLLVVADRGEIRADELALLLETPLSTIYRYLRTLTEFGFIERSEAGYRLGPRLLIGGGVPVSSEELIRHADPVLAMLVEETGETAVISRRVGLKSVCLHQQESRHALRVALEPGVPTQLDIGALAKTLLAYAPTDIQAAVLESGKSGRALRVELSRIRHDGIAHDDGETVFATVAIAVPVMRDDGIAAAIGIIAPVDRADPEWRMRTAELLADGARSISGGLRQRHRG